MRLLLTGDPIDAARAYELGLVNEVVPLAGLRPAAQALAERIAANAPLSVLAGKRRPAARRWMMIAQAYAGRPATKGEQR